VCGYKRYVELRTGSTGPTAAVAVEPPKPEP